jgi:hypothetical protein
MTWDPETAGTARLEAQAILERQRRGRERATVPPPEPNALARQLGDLIRRAESLTVRADGQGATELAELARDLAEMLRPVAAMAMQGAGAMEALR